MEKQAKLNYYNNIDIQLDDASKNNTKLYWKLVHDLFKYTSTSVISLYRLNMKRKYITCFHR